MEIIMMYSSQAIQTLQELEEWSRKDNDLSAFTIQRRRSILDELEPYAAEIGWTVVV